MTGIRVNPEREEPDFTSQKEFMKGKFSFKNVMDWIKAEGNIMAQGGATFFRASYHPKRTNVYLVEGWVKQPSDQGNPRFSED